MEQRMSRMEEMMADFQKSTLDFQEKFARGRIEISKQLSELMATMNRSRGDRRTEKSPDDQALNDEELVETEAETKSSGIEDRAVENEANSNVISAIVKEELIPHFLMVTEADSTCVQHTNVILQQVSISPLEHSLNLCKANLDVMGKCQYAMGKTHQIWSDTNFGCVNDDACQVFDVIPMRTKVLPKEHKERFHKSWRFKFKERKHRRGKLRSAHKLIHRVDVMEDDHVYQEGLPLWLLVRFKNWKFKYKHKHPLRILPCNAQHGFRGRKRSMCKLRPQQRLCVLEILERSMVPSLLSSSRGMLHPNESDFIEWSELLFGAYLRRDNIQQQRRKEKGCQSWKFKRKSVINRRRLHRHIVYFSALWVEGKEGVQTIKQNEYGTVSSSVWHRWRYKLIITGTSRGLRNEEIFELNERLVIHH